MRTIPCWGLRNTEFRTTPITPAQVIQTTSSPRKRSESRVRDGPARLPWTGRPCCSSILNHPDIPTFPPLPDNPTDRQRISLQAPAKPPLLNPARSHTATTPQEVVVTPLPSGGIPQRRLHRKKVYPKTGCSKQAKHLARKNARSYVVDVSPWRLLSRQGSQRGPPRRQSRSSPFRRPKQCPSPPGGLPWSFPIMRLSPTLPGSSGSDYRQKPTKLKPLKNNHSDPHRPPLRRTPVVPTLGLRKVPNL